MRLRRNRARRDAAVTVPPGNSNRHTSSDSGADNDVSAKTAAYGVDAAEVEALLELRRVLLDRRIGPIWWTLRFTQDAGRPPVSGDQIVGILEAYDRMHQHLASAERDYMPALAPQIRHGLDTLFDDLREPDKLTAVADVLARLLESALHRQDLADRLRTAAAFPPDPPEAR